MKIKFVDETEVAPKRQSALRSNDKYREFTRTLRKHPGQWAQLDDTYANTSAAYQRAHAIRNGVIVAFRTGTWDAVGRKLPNGETAVYVRFVSARTPKGR